MPTRLSSNFLALCRRVEQLRKHLLPPQFDPTGSYSPAQYDQVRGYIALVHAEIEGYLEERCLAVATSVVDGWTNSRTPCRVIVALHAICYSGWSGLLENAQFKKLTIEASVEARLSDALKQYRQMIGGNNGIKSDDLKRLLVPLSIRMSELDSSWVLAMSNFGQTRGEIVHQTSVGITQEPDPKAIRNKVWRELIPGLRELDILLTSLI